VYLNKKDAVLCVNIKSSKQSISELSKNYLKKLCEQLELQPGTCKDKRLGQVRLVWVWLGF
jgi:hypothetical protein